MNRSIQRKKCKKKTHFMDDTLKTRGIIYLNVVTWLLFAPPYQNFWLRACWLWSHFLGGKSYEHIVRQQSWRCWRWQVPGFYVALSSTSYCASRAVGVGLGNESWSIVDNEQRIWAAEGEPCRQSFSHAKWHGFPSRWHQTNLDVACAWRQGWISQWTKSCP